MLLFCKKNSLVKKRKHKTVLRRDAAANPLVAKGRGAVCTHFHAAAIKHHSSMQN
jgi:hypothetical protein